jgi:hypothetical protein
MHDTYKFIQINLIVLIVSIKTYVYILIVGQRDEHTTLLRGYWRRTQVLPESVLLLEC